LPLGQAHVSFVNMWPLIFSLCQPDEFKNGE
jgi:hypothetical protein